MNVTRIAPDWFDETHADKLHRGLEARFSHCYVKTSLKDDCIIISFIDGIEFNHVSNFLSGFIAAH